ncbi:retrovirus-related pol polyprotein from transposon TNT 1-94 [Tanacetum coccineum]|uniref:Retrovirus-related pol polyprotein from transposon TNT 1-94 n=1 Tax=Tanacetum coccineum TaxID=301880 RepID=A0ABQ5ANH1_9ASTR
MDDTRTMAQLLEAPTVGYEDAIVVPEITADNFELKHGLLTLVQNRQFFGHDKEDPHAHIRYFNKITSTMKLNVPSTSVKLMLFPFSLEGAARIWLEKEPPRSILTWDDLVLKFINKFFPPLKKQQLSNEIPKISTTILISKTLYIRRSFRSLWQKPNLQRTDTGAKGTTEGMKQNRNMSKPWKIGEIKDKEVNQPARDSDDALVCCIENTVDNRIMDSGASFHAAYCKEELERFKLRSGKVRLADDKTLDIAGVGDVVLKTSFGISWILKDVRYILGLKRRLILVGELDEEGYHVGFGDQQWKVTKGSLVVARGNKRGSLHMVEVNPERIDAIIDGSGSAALWFREAEEFFLHNVSEDKETAETAAGVAFCVENGIVMLKMVPKTPLQFGVAERLSRTFRAESTGLRAEAPKMLWADSVSTAYLIYRIPYVPIGLRIPEEEWRGKDTSLAYLKVFGCDSFVKVKDVCGEAMKCTFIGSGSDEMRYSFRDTKSHQVIRSRDITFVDSIYGAMSATDSSSLMKPIQKSQVVLVDISYNLAENDSIVADHGLSSKITQSPCGSSNTSEGSKNSGSFEDSGRSDEEDSKDGASSKKGGSETPHE